MTVKSKHEGWEKQGQDAGHPKLVVWQSGGMEREGRWQGGSEGRGHMYTYGQFILMYGKNHYNIVK